MGMLKVDRLLRQINTTARPTLLAALFTGPEPDLRDFAAAFDAAVEDKRRTRTTFNRKLYLRQNVYKSSSAINHRRHRIRLVQPELVALSL